MKDAPAFQMYAFALWLKVPRVSVKMRGRFSERIFRMRKI